MREHRVVCADGADHHFQARGGPDEFVRRAADLDDQIRVYARFLPKPCGPHRVQFRDVPEWQDLLGADTTGGGEANGR